jgi:Lon protease-like protein
MNEDLDGLGPDEGLVRLFPLPNLVLLPHVIQPLHVFEPRYRQLIGDSLADDRQFAMALLRPGWEDSYHKRPPLFPAVCLGRIYQEEILFDGRYNLLLHARRRARILEEVSTDRLYRTARVRWLDDTPVEAQGVERALAQRLGRVLTAWFTQQATTSAQIRQLLKSELPLGTICDVLAFALPLPLEEKQELLDEPRVEARVRRVLAFLEAQLAQTEPRPARRFPPEFSAN